MPLPGPTTAPKEALELRGSIMGKSLLCLPRHAPSPHVAHAEDSLDPGHDKERFRQTSKFLSIKSYIIHQLTGEYLVDPSIASASGLLHGHSYF